MIRTLFLIVVFLIGAVVSAVAFTPLGFVLEKSGAAGAGAGWAQAQGTMLNGKIYGLHIGGQPIGDVSLRLRPVSLLSLAPEFDMQWGGAGGQGAGVLSVSTGRVAVRELRAQQKISSIEGLTAPVRAIGGTLRLTDAAFIITPNGCESASGQISTDAVSKAAEQYGRQFGLVEGALSCIENDVAMSLNGQSERGDKVHVDGRSSLLGESELNAAIVTQDSEIVLALSQVGFVLRDGVWRYRYQQRGRLGQ